MNREEIKIGTPVIYWRVMKESGEKYDPIETEIESEAWNLGHGLPVCNVKGVSGGVSIKHLEAIETVTQWPF